MAGPVPSPCFARLADIWNHLALRGDVDDIILELLGRFSLERVDASTGDKSKYQHVLLTLLVQLDTIFYLQRLTLPSQQVQIGPHLGYLVSWEVAARTVELVLQTLVENREALWDAAVVRDEYLSEFLLGALRILALHPRQPSNQRSREKRRRLGRIHRLLEQIFDAYPGPKSFLLTVCKEVTSKLHEDPDSLSLPQRMRHELPNLAGKLYPLPPCLLPPYILELAPQEAFPLNWLAQFLALRDASHFIVGASIQYAANSEARNIRLHATSATSRNAVLNVLDNMRIPTHLSKVEMIATFVTTFRVALWDTLDLSGTDGSDIEGNSAAISSIAALEERLKDRQLVHRTSDREAASNISTITRGIQLLDDPTGQIVSYQYPSLFALNCSECHLVGGSQLRSYGIAPSSDSFGGREAILPPASTCPYCEDSATIAREVPLVRRVWELLKPLEANADTIAVERHLSTQFYLGSPSIQIDDRLPINSFGSDYSTGDQVSPGTIDPPSMLPTRQFSVDSTYSPGEMDFPDFGASIVQSPHPLTSPTSQNQFQRKGSEPWRSDVVSLPPKGSLAESNPGSSMSQSMDEIAELASFPKESSSGKSSRQSGQSPPLPSNAVRSPTSPDRAKSKWKMPFSSGRRASIVASGDSSSLSSGQIEDQVVEEVSLKALFSSSQKSSAKHKSTKSVSIYLSQSSTLALFWSPLTIQVWDAGTSPPELLRSITTESTCIKAVVGRRYLAYVVGTRDQKLTLRIVNLSQPSMTAVEYRISSSLWCRSLAIDRQENYVVVGFESCVVRFFKTAQAEQPREDCLHSPYHSNCKGCPSVDTLAFSNDGLALVASTRNSKGVIQAYLWRFPFLTFEELLACRYAVPLHESEDNGVSSAIIRSQQGDGENLMCITTWTQSGMPMLIQPQDGYRCEVKSGASGGQGRLGNRIQCAAFSPSGRELAMVNDKGNLFLVSKLNSKPMDIRRKATSREATTKSAALSLSFMGISGEDFAVLAWVDSAKPVAFIKKIPMGTQTTSSITETVGPVYVTSSSETHLQSTSSSSPRAELSGEGVGSPSSPVELDTTGNASSYAKLKQIPRRQVGLSE